MPVNDLYVTNAKRTTYQAIYRLASRPYALSQATGGAGRFQFATIYHLATAVRTVRLRHVWVAIESSTAAAIINADLVALTAATTPATGNPAITPSPTNVGDAAAEVTCLALPTTAGTEGAVQATQEWNLGITAAAPTTNPPPPLVFVDLLGVSPGATEPDFQSRIPIIRQGVREGWAVVIDASASATVKGYVVLEFTEESE